MRRQDGDGGIDGRRRQRAVVFVGKSHGKGFGENFPVRIVERGGTQQQIGFVFLLRRFIGDRSHRDGRTLRRAEEKQVHPRRDGGQTDKVQRQNPFQKSGRFDGFFRGSEKIVAENGNLRRFGFVRPRFVFPDVKKRVGNVPNAFARVFEIELFAVFDFFQIDAVFQIVFRFKPFFGGGDGVGRAGFGRVFGIGRVAVDSPNAAAFHATELRAFLPRGVGYVISRQTLRASDQHFRFL